jgi:hypothetical protein
MTNTAERIALKWIEIIGIGFDPCIRGFDYSPELTIDQQRDYDRDMEELCTYQDYEGIILAQMEKQGII